MNFQKVGNKLKALTLALLVTVTTFGSNPGKGKVKAARNVGNGPQTIAVNGPGGTQLEVSLTYDASNGNGFGGGWFNGQGVNSLGGITVYCINPALGGDYGNTFYSQDDSRGNSYNSVKTASAMSSYNTINRIIYYGYGYQGDTSIQRWAATQNLIWNALQVTDSIGTGLGGSGKWKFHELNYLGSDHALYSKYITEITELVNAPNARPSFTGGSQEFGSNRTITLTDTNGVLNQYNVTSTDSRVSVSVSGNTVTVTNNGAPSTWVSLNITRKDKNSDRFATGVSKRWNGTNRLSQDRFMAGWDAITSVVNMNDGTFNVRSSMGSASLTKTTTGGAPLAGVSYDLASNANMSGLITTKTTDAAGKINFGELMEGTYYVREKSAPAEYEISSAITTVVVKANSNTNVTFTNRKVDREIIVNKTGESGEKIAGVQYTLYNAANQVVKTATTDSSGVARFTGLTMGVYTVVETRAAEGYIIDSTRHTTGQALNVPNKDGSSSISLVNKHQKGKIVVQKVDPEGPNGETSLSSTANNSGFMGTIFRFKLIEPFFAGDTYDSEIGVRPSGRNFFATADNIPLGKYEVTEVKASTGYVKSDEVRIVNLIPSNGELSFDKDEQKFIANNIGLRESAYENSRILSNPQIYKYQSGTQKGLPGVKFDIYRDDNEVTPYITSVISDAQGLLKVKLDNGYTSPLVVPYGNYKVDEVETLPGYYISANDVGVGLVVTADGQDIHMNFQNGPQSSKINIQKVDVVTGKSGNPGTTLAGAQYDVIFRSATFPDIVKDVPAWANLKDGDVVERITTDSTGKASTTVSLPIGVYDIVEKVSSDGYQLEAASTRIETLYDGSSFEGRNQGKAVSELFNVLSDNRIPVAAQYNALNNWLNENVIVPGVDKGPVEMVTPHTLNSVEDGVVYLSEAAELGRFEIYKLKEEAVDASGNTIETSPEEGAVFHLIDENGVVVDELTTNAEGYATSKYVPIGKYVVKQISGPEGWFIANPIDVTISKMDEVHRIDITNKAKFTRLKIVKRDVGTGVQIAQPGVTFRLYDSLEKANRNDINEALSFDVVYPEEETLREFVTNKDGEFTFPMPLKNGDYFLVETIGPEGYYVDPDGAPVKVTIKGNITTIVIDSQFEDVYNTPQYGQLIVDKKGDVLDKWTQEDVDVSGESHVLNSPVTKEAYLANAHFEIEAKEDIMSFDGSTKFYSKGDIVGNFVTDVDGNIIAKKGSEIWSVDLNRKTLLTEDTKIVQVRSENPDENRGYPVPLGEYILREAEAPDGYKGYGEDIPFELLPQEQTVKFDFTTAAVWNDKQTVKFKFVKDFENAEWHKYHEEAGSVTFFGLYTREDLVVNGVTLPSNSLVGITGLDENLAGEFKAQYEGKYFIKELSTHEAYELNETEHAVDFNLDKDAEIETEVEIENIENELKKITIEITKVSSESGEVLPNAEYELFVIVDGEEKSLGKYFTDENGNLVIPDLEYGDYKLYEVTAPDGYIPDKEGIEFDKDGNIIPTNPNIDGDGNHLNEITQTEFSKVDLTDSKELPGAKISVRDKETGEIVDEWTSTEDSHVIKGLTYGKTYIMREDLTPIGYVTASEIEFTVTEDHKIGDNKITMFDDVTKVTINKLDKITQEHLAGIHLQIVHASTGGVWLDWITDGQPKEITKIPVGDYFLREIETLPGYILAEDVPFTILDSAEMHEVTMLNDYTKIEISKLDGDDNKMLAGAELQLVDMEDNVVAEWTSSDEMVAKLDKIPVGTYTLVETKAPIGFSKADPIEITVLPTGELQEFELENFRRLLNVQIVKRGAESKQLLNGALFKVEEIDSNEELTGRVEYHESGKLNLNGPANGTVLLSRSEDMSNATTHQLNENGHIALDEAPGIYFFQVVGSDEVRMTKAGEGMAFLFEVKQGYGYLITELVAPDKYWVGNQPAQMFFPEAEEGTIEIEYERINELDPNLVEVPPTGDSTVVGSYVGALATSGLAILALAKGKKKEEDSEE